MIAVLSNGPSARLWNDTYKPRYSAVIGVNWTVERWVCDWWCFFDWQTFRKVLDPLGRPIIFTRKPAIEKMARFDLSLVPRFESYTHQLIENVSIPAQMREIPEHAGFSGLMALALAWHLGDRQVHAYGMDMAGTGDHAGTVQDDGRTEHRWGIERQVFEAWCRCFSEAGREVRRVGPVGVCQPRGPTTV
jgi:hypothetical protein